MEILGLSRIPPVVREKAAQPSRVDDRGGWFRILESYTGAWQRNDVLDVSLSNITTNPIVFACASKLASTVAKLALQLERRSADGGWLVTESPIYSPVLRRPNLYSNRQQFLESWILSKVLYGNAFILKMMNARFTVDSLYVLDPSRVSTLVSPDGSLFYDLRRDDLSRLPNEAGYRIPGEFVIHDRGPAFWHPLVGQSPLMAAAISAAAGLNITSASASFFGNASTPSGVLTAPGSISQETADRMRQIWNDTHGGGNIGSIAVLGDGLTFNPMSMKFSDSQMVETAKMSAEQICTAFGVPAWLVGVGQMPAFGNIESATTQFYSGTIQAYLEAVSLCLTDGFRLPSDLKVSFDLNDLFKTDTKTTIETLVSGVRGAIFSPNEARRRIGLPPVEGGDTPLIQAQDIPIASLERPQPAPALPAAEKGKPKLHFKGSYAYGQEYQQGDAVLHLGRLWAVRVGYCGPRYPAPGENATIWQAADGVAP